MPAADKPVRARSAPGPLGANYWRLLSASTLGNLGDGIALVALPWYASTLTDDPLAISAVGVATRLPWLLLALVAGAVGDRVDRRRLMVLAGSGKASVLVALTALVVFEVASIPVVLLAALLVGLCEVFFDNTSQALLPTVVPRSRLERANSIIWGAEQVLNRFVGAPLAGVLVALSLSAPFAVQAALAFGAVLAVLTMRGDFHAPRAPQGEHPPVRVMLAEGVRWLWGHRLLRTLTMVLALSNLAAAMNIAILVLFAQDVLGLDSRGYGLLLTASACGAVTGSVVVPWIAQRFPAGAALAVSLALQAGAYTMVSLVHNVPVFAVCWVAVGFSTIWWNVVTVSMRQRIIPDRLMSRVSSAHRTLGWGMVPIGMGLAGGVASFLEPELGRQAALSAPFLVAGLLSFVLVAVSLRYLTTPLITRALADAEQ